MNEVEKVANAFEIMMLGVGNEYADTLNNTSAMLLSTEYNLVINFGMTSFPALSLTQYNINDIDGVLITSLQSDRIGGLEQLARRAMYGEGDGKLIDLIGEKQMLQDLWDKSLRGGLEFANGGEPKKLDDYFNLVELEPKVPHIIRGYKLELIRTPHIPQMISYSVIINDSLFYSGDVRFDERLIQAVHEDFGCTTIFHDCSIDPESFIHATLENLLTLEPEIQEKIYLMNFDDSWITEDDIGQLEFLREGAYYNFENGYLTEV